VSVALLATVSAAVFPSVSTPRCEHTEVDDGFVGRDLNLAGACHL
jgi:hypothetical protein